ncbi:MAG: hypothetical protein R2759_11025 [Bacteroidales bacterium]
MQAGDTLWTRTYGDDHAIGFTSIARKTDGNFVMTNGRNNVAMLCVATVDPDGNMVTADTVQWSPEINYAATQAEGYDVCANAFEDMVTGKENLPVKILVHGISSSTAKAEP